MIEILVVEHSEAMSDALIDSLNSDPDINVVGIARDGFEAIRKINDYAPDVVLLNLNVPGRDGIEIIQELDKVNPGPVVLFSELTDHHSERLTDSWFESIVVEIIQRPETPADVPKLFLEIKAKIKSAADSHLRKIIPEKKLDMKESSTQDKIIILAASTGGPPAISYLLSSFPKKVPCPIIIIQHMPSKFTKSFSRRLNSICEIEVKIAEKGEKLQNGIAYVAPGDYHLELENTFGTGIYIALTKKRKELGVRPSANITMRTAAMIYKDATIGVILTGMGHDGTNGAKFIKRHFGTVIIESKKTCVVYGMPGAVFKSGYYDLVLNLEDIPRALIQCLEI